MVTMSRTESRTQRGFTLAELMMTLAIIAVIVGIGIPSFQSFIKNQRIRNASFDLNSSLTLARSEATKRSADVTITQVGGSWAQGWTITTPGAAGDDTLMTHDALNDIAIVANAASVTFRHTGRLPAGVATPSFEINNATPIDGVTKRCLTLDLSGKVMNECMP